MKKIECDDQMVSEITGDVKGDFCLRDQHNLKMRTMRKHNGDRVRTADASLASCKKAEGPEWSPREVAYRVASLITRSSFGLLF